MYKTKQPTKSLINVNEAYEGERIETKIERITTNKEPITDGAPLYYTERKDGVNPFTDIRTDRFEIATDVYDKITKEGLTKRQQRIEMQEAAKNSKKPEQENGPQGPNQEQ